MRFSAWSSDVCSSDLVYQVPPAYIEQFTLRTSIPQALKVTVGGRDVGSIGPADTLVKGVSLKPVDLVARTAGSGAGIPAGPRPKGRSEEHTSELQSLMRISYAVFCLKKKNTEAILI